MRSVALSTALALSACGYAWVQPRAAALRLGVVEDLSAEGDLGVVVQRRVRDSVVVRDEGPLLGGTVRVEGDGPVAYDGDGVAALYEQPVVVTLELRDEARVLWSSGPRRRRALFARGASPLDTETARRVALAQAARDATDDALLMLPEAP